MVYFVYLIIAFFATLIGGISGMGGGIIIKPALDTMGVNDIQTILVLSSVTVLVMSVVSVVKQSRAGFQIDKSLVILAVSSLLGGVAGNQMFSLALAAWPSTTVSMLQIVLNILLLVIAVLKGVFKQRKADKFPVFVATGFILGALCTFIGIGGGPINVAALMLIFGYDVKKAVVGSLFIIMFSQTMNVAMMVAQPDFASLSLTPLFVMVPAAVAGGYLSSVLCKRISCQLINIIFTFTVGIILILNVYNLISLII